MVPAIQIPTGPVEDLSLPNASKPPPPGSAFDLTNRIPVAGRKGSVVDLKSLGDRASELGSGGGFVFSSEQVDELLQIWSFLIQFE